MFSIVVLLIVCCYLFSCLFVFMFKVYNTLIPFVKRYFALFYFIYTLLYTPSLLRPIFFLIFIYTLLYRRNLFIYSIFFIFSIFSIFSMILTLRKGFFLL